MYHSVLKLFLVCLKPPNDVFQIKLKTMAKSISFSKPFTTGNLSVKLLPPRTLPQASSKYGEGKKNFILLYRMPMTCESVIMAVCHATEKVDVLPWRYAYIHPTTQ